MDLSTNTFSEMLACLGGESGDASRDKRRSQRMNMHATLQIARCTRPPQLCNVRLKNLSPRGIGFEHTRTLAEREQFIAFLPRKSGGSIAMLCTVMHCQQHKSGVYIGAEFACILNGRATPKDEAATQQEIQRIQQSILE